MTKAQKSAVRKLESALNACSDAGLKGGVFDNNFCVWPIDANPNPYDSGWDFFNVIEKTGCILSGERVRMSLDGGAGV